MADSENDRLTGQEKKLVQTILSRVWLSMDWSKDNRRYEANEITDETPLALTREEMDTLANAINKI